MHHNRRTSSNSNSNNQLDEHWISHSASRWPYVPSPGHPGYILPADKDVSQLAQRYAGVYVQFPESVVDQGYVYSVGAFGHFTRRPILALEVMRRIWRLARNLALSPETQPWLLLLLDGKGKETKQLILKVLATLEQTRHALPRKSVFDEMTVALDTVETWWLYQQERKKKQLLLPQQVFSMCVELQACFREMEFEQYTLF